MSSATEAGLLMMDPCMYRSCCDISVACEIGAKTTLEKSLLLFYNGNTTLVIIHTYNIRYQKMSSDSLCCS